VGRVVADPPVWTVLNGLLNLVGARAASMRPWATAALTSMIVRHST